MTPELIQFLESLGASPLHVVLMVALVLLWRDNRTLRQDFIEYLKHRVSEGDAAAQRVLDRRNGTRS